MSKPNISILDDEFNLEPSNISTIKTAMPEWQRLDLEPKAAGKSLLHNELGLPISPRINTRETVPLINELSAEPLFVKALENDKFIPPKSNFVAVGQTDQEWIEKSQIEQSRKSPKIVDNNQVVDISSLQGIDPLNLRIQDDSSNSTVNEVLQNLTELESIVISKICKVTNLTQLNDLYNSVFTSNGYFNYILQQVEQSNLTSNIRLNEAISDSKEKLLLELQAKKLEFLEPEQLEPIDEEIFNEPEPEPELQPQTTESKEIISDNVYILYVDRIPFFTTASKDLILEKIYSLITKNNKELSDLMLVKRIPIDFGIILKD
jgi:hypothetical protein